ncbi:DUF1570 domain-containing protein [Tautonia sp. JC769]|uniref:DUF1570 domain-containing protein n=1 Tax=Tautonia sp. JC769 TaxID=3232135 RepID=UPI00345795EC
MLSATGIVVAVLLGIGLARSGEASSTPSSGVDVQASSSRSLEILSTESEALEALANRLESTGDASHAQAVRALIEPSPRPDGPNRFIPMPEIVPAGDDVSDDADTIPEVDAIRSEAATQYEELANQAFEAGQLALADASLRNLLRRRPDDTEARRLLGYVPHEGGWATPHAILRLENGDIPHPDYGWIPAEWVPNLEQGLLPAAPRVGRAGIEWVPAAEADAARQGAVTNGWQITTPHFKIQASVPLDEGIDFGRRLEAFYDLFTSVGADLIGPQRLQLAQLKRSASATAPPNAPRQHRVFYFGTKQQYVDYLAPRLRDPGIKDTLGIYLDTQKSSYFFKDEGGLLPVEATLYHEVSHQLLFELAGSSEYLRNAGDFWVFEGLGTYFETVAPQDDGTIHYGGRIGPRFEEAHRRHVERDELIPVGRFVSLDRVAFNGGNGGDPHLHYAQAIALTVYLMDHDHGRDREAFLDYARNAYRGQLRPGSDRSLATHLGRSFDELDEEFRAFVARPIGRDRIEHSAFTETSAIVTGQGRYAESTP